MFSLLLLTVRVHSESSVWIDLDGPSEDSQFIIYSSFVLFVLLLHQWMYFPYYYFFIIYIFPVFLLGCISALVPSKLDCILINDYD